MRCMTRGGRRRTTEGDAREGERRFGESAVGGIQSRGGEDFVDGRELEEDCLVGSQGVFVGLAPGDGEVDAIYQPSLTTITITVVISTGIGKSFRR